MEDMATGRLQYDLENILRALAKRHICLSKKLSKDVQSTDKKEEKLKIPDIEERRPSVSDVKPFKKIKSEKTQKSFSARAKPAKSQETGKSSDVSKLMKDSPSRFWAFMDCFSSDINLEDIKVLERWIEMHGNDFEYQTVPELGAHYSNKWIEEDILEEKKEGTKSMENPKGTDCDSTENILESELYEKIEEKIAVDPDQPSFIEKLMLSLVHENIISSPSDIMTEPMPDEDQQQKKTNETLQVESNHNTLESRLRAQFSEQGILKSDLDETVDDELLLELKRLQSLLIPVSKHNQQKKEALLIRAKAEIAKQQAQKRIKEVDAKIMENYRAVAALRLKGKKMSKKDSCQIKSILEERDVLIKNSKIMT